MEKNPASNWQSDPAGRVRNISLAPSAKNTLYPLFEAVMNSIHAVEERFGKDHISNGIIDITIIRQDENCIGFRIDDNGIGFTPSNISSFTRMDSQTKATIGGKGVGRLLWLKVLEKAHIKSTFINEDKITTVDFDFCIDDPLYGFLRKIDSHPSNIGTSVNLYPYKIEYASQIPKKASTIANRVLAHFISYFINISQPKITVIDNDNVIDLFDQFTLSTERDQDFSFSIDTDAGSTQFTVHCFLLPKAISDDEKSTNALYLGANGRAVKRFDMDAVLGLKAIDGKYAFLGYVESDALDDSVNETRTEFSISDESISDIVDKSKAIVHTFLAAELKDIRDRQTNVVAALRIEHPRFLSIASDPKTVADSLHYATQSKEEIYVELSRQSLRAYERRKNGFRKSLQKKLPDIHIKAAEYVSGLKAESLSSLAEYVMKRKLILEVFEDSLKFKDVEKQSSEYEDILHDIICPLKSTTDELEYEDHNLWIVDDRLAFYSYFNSDIKLRKQVDAPTRPDDRPDISVFDLGLAFQNDDTSTPITIIEFKRPKIDNYSLANNPITQVRKYVDDMRDAGQAVRFDGSPLRAIDQTTPFMCHIIADMTPTLKSVMKDLGSFHRRAGSNSYYCWDPSYSIFIEISSFKDVLHSAKSRNRAFFERIGLT
ncbi:histidine kinase/DNA gyrase B/HSP90-like ATPase [Ancylobacter aquaticus]|uniref:Histidine kinase/DNA gyrase B/HSP90-like ATPase n=1 Tax=Ancylobacter aquaticus TaxID=100 RepID=A0A4R1I996_ANCAQ|nr:ATP-binding protein [Ancylobacter aquaticus]TCK30160.1 histidine kinase/DNA gyrase B/HSP90-like ATPase [Ancylobacter aquaticus]